MATKVLLLADVENVGDKGQIVDVKSGFAFNFFIPSNMAQVADANSIRRQAKLQEERRKEAVENKRISEELAGRLQGVELEAHVKVDHDGHMYGSVSALDISHLLKAQTGIDVEKRNVLLKSPIKQTGVFEVALQFKEGVTASVHIKVTPEGM